MCGVCGVCGVSPTVPVATAGRPPQSVRRRPCCAQTHTRPTCKGWEAHRAGVGPAEGEVRHSPGSACPCGSRSAGWAKHRHERAGRPRTCFAAGRAGSRLHGRGQPFGVNVRPDRDEPRRRAGELPVVAQSLRRGQVARREVNEDQPRPQFFDQPPRRGQVARHPHPVAQVARRTRHLGREHQVAAHDEPRRGAFRPGAVVIAG